MLKPRSFALAVLLLALFMGLGLQPAGAQTRAPKGSESQQEDPWLQKPVLSYLMNTSDPRLDAERRNLFQALHASKQEILALQALARKEQQTLQLAYQQSQAVLLDDTASTTVKTRAVTSHNKAVENAMAETDQALRQLLGQRYADFRAWVRAWWPREQKAVAQLKQSPPPEPGIQSDAFSCYMYATQYHGYTRYEVALPDKYVKFANLGWYIPPPYNTRYNRPPYTVHIYRNNHWAWSVLVRDVGPWNIDDNYWDLANGANPRRRFRDIPLCWSEAEYAYYYHYNGGRDQFGRRVTVPSSVDLTPAVAADLGLRYLENSWVWVYYYDLP